MELWAAIKYAMNSTLGTDKFKPLDKVIDETINNVFEKSVGVFASDNVLYNFGTISKNGSSDTKTLKMTGSVRIEATTSSGYQVYVYINGKLSTSFGLQGNYAIVNVRYGDELFISGSGAEIRNAKICGTPFFSPREGVIV